MDNVRLKSFKHYFISLFIVMTGEMFVPGWSSQKFEFQLGDK